MVIYWPLYYFDTELTSWNLGFLSTLRGYVSSHYPYFPDILYHGDSDANIDLGRERSAFADVRGSLPLK